MESVQITLSINYLHNCFFFFFLAEETISKTSQGNYDPHNQFGETQSFSVHLSSSVSKDKHSSQEYKEESQANIEQSTSTGYPSTRTSKFSNHFPKLKYLVQTLQMYICGEFIYASKHRYAQKHIDMCRNVYMLKSSIFLPLASQSGLSLISQYCSSSGEDLSDDNNTIEHPSCNKTLKLKYSIDFHLSLL